MKVRSPLTGKNNTEIDKTISCSKLVEEYSKALNIDISNFFVGLNNIDVYRCLDTGYRFFFPFNISGDSKFYEHLQQFDWYYMPWKWEHKVTKYMLLGTEKILEVGSGGYSFVERMEELGFDLTGLELNKLSVQQAKNLGLNAFNETVEEHSLNNYETYDVVCSFQVLEHITNVDSFLKAQIDCLKKGGKLIISVPNNNSFIKYINGGVLNHPPHHMGLWDKGSLCKLTNFYNLKKEKVLYEPLQSYHVDWFVDIIEGRINKSIITKKLYNKFKLSKNFKRLVKRFRKRIKGHTIMVIFTKR